MDEGNMREATPRLRLSVWDRLLDYYEPHEAAEWLISPHPQLEGQVPAVLLAQRNVEPLHAILDRLDGDVYL